MSNANSNIILECRWEVVAHKNDPPHTPDAHAWISVAPNRFSQNRVECCVQIDASKLRRLAGYERQLILHTNAAVPKEQVTIKVQTGDLPFKRQNMPYFALGSLLLLSVLLGWLGTQGYLSSLAHIMASLLGWLTIGGIVLVIPIIGTIVMSGILGALIGGLGSGMIEALGTFKAWAFNRCSFGVGVCLAVISFANLLADPYKFVPVLLMGSKSLTISPRHHGFDAAAVLADAIIRQRHADGDIDQKEQLIQLVGLGVSYALISFIAILPLMLVFSNLCQRQFNPVFAGLLLFLIGGVGASLGTGIAALHPTLFALVVTGLALVVLLLLVERHLLLAKYQKSEDQLIPPDRSRLLH